MKATIKSRFSLGMKLVGILSCLAILSVGFAAWWIIELPDPVTKEGSFEVHSVDAKKIEFKNVGFEGNANIIFGAPENPGTASWLGYTSDVSTQNLSAILKVTVSIDSNENLNGYLNGVQVDFAAGDKYNGLVEGGYVKAPTVSYRIGTTGDWTALPDSKIIPAPASKEADVYIKFDFGWGSLTNNENPYTYFSGKALNANHETVTDKTNKAVAEDVLGKIYSEMNTSKYTVVLTAVPKAN